MVLSHLSISSFGPFYKLLLNIFFDQVRVLRDTSYNKASNNDIDGNVDIVVWHHFALIYTHANRGSS